MIIVYMVTEYDIDKVLIKGMFSTKELADRYIEQQGLNCYIDEWIIDKEV